MTHYLLRRLLLLPLTLLSILIVNFTIINLAPGEPTTIGEISQDGAKKQDQSVAAGSDDRYLQFREFYGLTLPVLLNDWPWLSQGDVNRSIWSLTTRKISPSDPKELSAKEYDALKIRFGDQSRFVMGKLLALMEDPSTPFAEKRTASRFFARGGTRMAILGGDLTEEQQRYNEKTSADNSLLYSLILRNDQDPAPNIARMRLWYEENKEFYTFEPTLAQKISILFFETRLVRYLKRVLTLDFGVLRNDRYKTVTSEVAKRFKYSLTLTILPMCLTFVLCQVFGFTMAYLRGKWPDLLLNLTFLVLYAIPIFVAAPFLIEKVAMQYNFPFTNTPIPVSGFTSPDALYNSMTSWERLVDIAKHVALPILAILYGGLAAESRLSRTAVLEVLKQDFVRTAKAKGLGPTAILWKHVARNASITIITSLAGSLGLLLGGSLIVETLFDINGFGKFFYDAILNRDYNVIMFSTLAGAFLTLCGYLAADIAYTLLDPRVSLEKSHAS